MTSIKQKLGAILVLSLFLLSVIPAGLAEEVKGTIDTEVKAEAHLDSNAADAEVKTQAKTEVEAENNNSEVKDNHSSQKEKAGKMMKRDVKQLKQVFANARERLENAKENFEAAKEEQHQQREKVVELNKKVKLCNSERKDCAELKTELRLGVKNHLTKSVQVVERSLEKLTSTVEKMEDLPTDEKEHALTLIAGLNTELEAQKAKIDAFTANTTQEEIRAAIKDLKELNQKVHKLQRRLVGLLVEAKLHVLVDKHAELHTQMQARIDAAAAKGINVTELESVLAEFDAKAEMLKQDYEAASLKWTEADTNSDFDQFNQQVRDAQHKVREDLQDSKQILRQFVADYRDQQGNHEVDEKVGTQENDNETSADDKTGEQKNDQEDTDNQTSVDVNASADTAIQG